MERSRTSSKIKLNKTKQNKIKQNRKDSGNGGYTLVEIIVAVVILAIVVFPLLRSFVTVARVNAKARNEQEATMVAQNLMESIKASSMEELIGSSEAFVDADGNVIEDEAGNPEMKVDVSTDDTGVCRINYNQCEMNGREYRAVVKLDPTSYRKEEDVDPEQYNDMEIADITAMSSKTDAFFVQDIAGDSDAAAYFADAAAYSQMTRSIIMDIDKNVDDKIMVYVTVEYVYNGNVYAAVEKSCIYSGTADKPLENVYLFFQPMYTGNGGTAKETIQVNNNATLPLNVFLVKQGYSGVTGAQEQNYRVNVNITENSRSDFLKDGEYYVLTDVQTNLDTTKNQMRLTYGGLSQMSLGGSVYTAEELTGVADDTSLVKETRKDRLYAVEISVYRLEDETYEKALVTLTGTKEE